MSSTNLESSSQIYDVIILGAGISGLATAYEILSNRPDSSVLILEARDRVGGRIHTLDLNLQNRQVTGEKAKVDLGASFVHGIVGNPLTDLSKKVPFTLHLPPSDSSLQIYSFSGELLPEKEAERLSYLSHSITFERLHRSSQSSGSIKDSESVYLALKNEDAGEGVWEGVGEEERRKLMEISQQWSGWTGASLNQVSFKYWGFEQEFSGPDAIVKEGYETLIYYYEEKIRELEGMIELENVVEQISENQDDEEVTVKTKVRDEFKERKARFVICTLPLGVLKHSPPKFSPPLSDRRLSSIENLGMGLLNKLVLQYSVHWWPSHPESEGWIMLLPSPSWSSLIQSFNSTSSSTISKETAQKLLENCPLLLQDYFLITGKSILVSFFGPPLSQALEILDDFESSEIVNRRLNKTIKSSTRSASNTPTRVSATRWNSDPFSRGSYSFLPCSNPDSKERGASPLDMMECSHSIWNGKLGFGGEHTEHDCYASVHGALMSGKREGKRVIDLLGAGER